MKTGMIPASVGGGCGIFQPYYATPVGPPASLITPAPPPELLAQNLLRRQAQDTCGFSGSDFFGCPLNSYCIYDIDYGRWDCCAVSSDSSIAATCAMTQTVCSGSSASVAAFGTGLCAAGVACCGNSDYPECVTAILSENENLSFSSFFCYQTDLTITVTPYADYTAQTQTSVSVETTTQSDSTTLPASTVTTSILPSSTSASSSGSSPSISSTSSAMSVSSLHSSKSPTLTSVSPPSSVPFTPLTGAAASSATSGNSIADTKPHTTESTFDQHKGAIIGGTVAGVVIFLLLALALFIRHRLTVKKREAGLFGGQEMSGRVVSDGTVYSKVPGGGYGS